MRKPTLLLLLAVSAQALAQVPANDGRFKYVNSVQVEAFGHCIIYSLNYERILINGSRWKTSAQAGGCWRSSVYDGVWHPRGEINSTVIVTEMYSLGWHHFEIGLGYFVRWPYFPGSEHALYVGSNRMVAGRIGYRFQIPLGRLVARAAFTPFWEHNTKHFKHGSLEIYAWGGLAIGYNFGLSKYAKATDN